MEILSRYRPENDEEIIALLVSHFFFHRLSYLQLRKKALKTCFSDGDSTFFKIRDQSSSQNHSATAFSLLTLNQKFQSSLAVICDCDATEICKTLSPQAGT